MTALKMKALECTRYGSPDFLQITEIEIPNVGNNEILVKVKASSITAADTMMRRAKPFISRLFLGLLRPSNSIMGTGFAGVVENIGSDVKKFQVGDRVFGETGLAFGANAEYVLIDEDGVIAKIPSELTYAEAAPVCDGALTSLNFLKELAQIKQGQTILINGASGGLGTSAVQLAKLFGAKVTGVCGPTNSNLVYSLGADEVIDYTKTDFKNMDEKYDIVFDTVGKLSFSKSRKILKDHGIYMSPVLGWSLLFQIMWTSIFGSKLAKFSATGLKSPPKLLELLSELLVYIKEDKLITVLDRKYSLSEAPDGHRYVDQGHKKGNVVITF